MTEDEAKTKWCPFVRAPHLGTAGINRQIDEQPTPQARCIGSSCMGWRWVKTKFLGFVDPSRPPGGIFNGFDEFLHTEPERPKYVTDDWVWDSKRGFWIVEGEAPERGYCGLAGKP